MEKFHHFLYGTHFILKTDQKPLEAILSKIEPSNTTIAKNCYPDIPISFYSASHLGPMNLLANCLSRLGTQDDNIKLPKLHIYQITNQLKARSHTLNQLHIATDEDDELMLLKHTITNGWPSCTKGVPAEIQAYWTFHEELTIKDGLVLKVLQLLFLGISASKY